ncbi:hypothetical protein EI94DRAFT_1729355 [Lactarius quietus]|nr:hypothetical protein EI94DRAFT_1729355 [Lactarius quietus]
MLLEGVIRSAIVILPLVPACLNLAHVASSPTLSGFTAHVDNACRFSCSRHSATLASSGGISLLLICTCMRS